MASQEERDRIMAEYLASVERDDDDDNNEEDDDDEDDEAEFQPGIDDGTDDDNEDDEDNDDDDDDDDEDDSEAVRWKGKLSFANGTLKYSGVTSEGNTFHLLSNKSESLYWNWNHPTAMHENDQKSRMRTIALEGTPSNISVTLTATDLKEQRQHQHYYQNNNKSLKEDDHDSDEDDGKMAAQMPPAEGKKPATTAVPPALFIYSVYGQGDGFELYGELLPHTLSHPDKQSAADNVDDNDATTSVFLECRYRNTTQQHHAAARAAGAAAVATAVSDDDDDDDIVDADQGVDYNELIALHEDAGMTVGEIRKRFGRRHDATTAEEEERSNKKAKSIPQVEQDDEDEDDDDDDDDDVGF